MFARLFAVASLAALAVAGPLVVRNDGQCNTASVAQCCNSVQQAGAANKMFSDMGIIDALVGVTGMVGLGCSPIVGNGADCSQTPVCCEGNKFNGLVNVGCSPINVSA